MTRADDYILELLRDAGISTNPSTIAFNIDYDPRYVSQRCRELENNGLVERMSEAKAMYRITEIGERYLDGELNADLEVKE